MRSFWTLLIVALLAALGFAQEQPNPTTLLPEATLNAIAAEVSGAQAHNHVLDMCGYEHVRPAEEYAATYREAVYAEAKAKEYGFSDVKIERFPAPQRQWAAEMAELWTLEPEKRLITRLRDLPATLATGSRSADIAAELVYAGRGDNERDYEGKDVKGKIVLVSGPVNAAHSLAVRRYGAEGVVSFFNGTGKPIDRPDQIGWLGIAGPGGGGGAPPPRAEGAAPRTTFGFILSHRMGMDLLAQLENRKKVVVQALVKAADFETPMQVVVATIPGDGSTDQEVVFTGHLFEGIAKQGANDNCSGPATEMEAGRAWIKLIKDGVLPRPRRTVRFLWVPEIAGTRAYLQRYPEHPKHVLAAVNMDMVGSDQTRNHNSLHLFLTPASLPSFAPDVGVQMIRYVGDTNREKLHNRRIAYAFANPIIDPKGSHDPFWYHVEKFYGSSDHQVYLDAEPRVAALGFGNWPDAVYHSSEDSPAFLDPTQMKRAAFLAVAVGDVLATAGPKQATAIAALTAAHAQERIGEEMARAVESIAASSKPVELATNYKEALNLIRQAYIRETAAIRSTLDLVEKDSSAQYAVAQLAALLGEDEKRDLERVTVAYGAAAAALGATPLKVAPPLTDAEQKAALLYPRRKPGTPRQPVGFGGGPPNPNAPLRGYYVMEARNWADGEHSILDIRNALSAEFQPVPVENVERFFRDLEKEGGWEINEKQPAPADKGRRASRPKRGT